MECLKLVIILIVSQCFDDHAHDRDNGDRDHGDHHDHGDDYDHDDHYNDDRDNSDDHGRSEAGRELRSKSQE